MYASSSGSLRVLRPRQAVKRALCVALGLIWLVGGAGSADADGATKAKPPVDTTAKPIDAPVTKVAAKPKRTRPETAALYADTKGKGQTKAVAAALERALGTRAEVKLTRLKKLIGASDRGPALKEAFAKIDKGEMDLANMEVDKGLRAIHSGIKALEKDFDVVGPDGVMFPRFVRALTTLALAHFLAGNKSKTSEWLSRALVMNPKIDYDKKRFPPKMKEVFDTVHFFAAEVGKGKGKIDTVPNGALVRINGKPVGRSPTMVDGLAVGRNLVTVTAMGYTPKTVPLNVQGGKTPAAVKVTLDKLPGDPMAQLAKAAKAVTSGGTTSPGKAAKLLGVELLVLASISGAADRFEVKLYAYDAKANKIVGRSKGSINILQADRDINKVVDGLFTAIRVTRSPPKLKPKGPGFFSRMVKSKWFWPVVGAVAGAAAIAGATVGIVMATGGSNTRRNAILLPAFSAR
jgi:hypothetical protein